MDVKTMQPEEKLRMTGKLDAKLERLQWTNEKPELFIAEHFVALKNEIDLYAERIIDQLGTDDSEKLKIARLNQSRRAFIDLLDKKEQSLLEKLQQAATYSTPESFGELKKRVEEFAALKEDPESIQVEEIYEQLTMDIFDATNELERRLLDNQTFVYWPSSEQYEMGKLIYMSDYYVTANELKSFQKTQTFPKPPLDLEVRRSLTLTEKTIVMIGILFQLKKMDYDPSCILFVGRKSKKLVEASDDPFFNELKIDLSEYLNSSQLIETIRIAKMPSCFSTCSFKFPRLTNRLKSFQIVDASFMPQLQELDLNDAQLETLDEQMLAKGTKLQVLKLQNALHPDAMFSLGFLSTLTNLTHLELTLPDAPIDFAVFEALKMMKILKLFSAASRDSNIQYPMLSVDQFKQLSMMPSLESLRLTHFEIETLKQELLSGFKNIQSVFFVDNKIAHVDVGAFSSMFTEPKSRVQNDRSTFGRFDESFKVNLSFNQIETLSPDAFAESNTLRFLLLNHNCIQRIQRGQFGLLANLESLELDHNPIETVEAGSFEGLDELDLLSIQGCGLRSIDGTVIDEIGRLRILLLDFNSIDKFEIANVDTNGAKQTIRGILSPAEYELVETNLFYGMEYLQMLSLRGNKLEKLDLNCLCNLTSLKELDVSRNLIDELNEQIRPGVLSQLECLDLSQNRLVRISPNAFSESKDLQVLCLSGNKLETIDFIDSFEKLGRLELQDNNLSIDITAKRMSKFAFLMQINLIGNPRVRVEENAFKAINFMYTLKLELAADSDPKFSAAKFLANKENSMLFFRIVTLAMVNCSLENFDMFKGRLSNLKELDLRRNRFRTLRPDNFSGFARLEFLDLSENLIETLEDPAVFQHLSGLLELRLSGNKLKSINRYAFKGLGKLESLNISNNPTLVNMDINMFRVLYNIQELNLAGNNIESFDMAFLFRSCRLLEFLDLSNNQLDNESINETSMSGVIAQNLKELMLANNRLEKMDFVRNLYRLEKLDLSGNKIESVICNGVKLLGRLVKLEYLNLNGNANESLDSESFHPSSDGKARVFRMLHQMYFT